MTADQELVAWPQQPESWLALGNLATLILDPVIDHFGPIQLTYAFAPPALTRHIARGIAPRLDQHASHELNLKGNPVCGRGGAAVDFRVPDVPASALVDWVMAETPVDRVYFYRDERAVHVSWAVKPLGRLLKVRGTMA